MRKKAMAASMVAALILALVFTSVGITIVQKMDKGTSKVYDKQLCKQSVILNSKARYPLLNKEETSLECPTRYVTFYKDKVIFESRKYEDKQVINCGNLNSRTEQECYLTSTNKVISNLLYDCWDQFAAGRIEVLDAWGETKEARQCVICARFEFDTEVQKSFTKSVGELELGLTGFTNKDAQKDFTLDNFMRSHNPALHKISYYEFTMDPVDAFKYPYYDYNLKDSYAVLFTAINKYQRERITDDMWEFMKTHKLTIPYTGFNVNPVYDEGAKEKEELEFVNVMDLVKYGEVAGLCDTLD